MQAEVTSQSQTFTELQKFVKLLNVSIEIGFEYFIQRHHQQLCVDELLYNEDSFWASVAYWNEEGDSLSEDQLTEFDLWSLIMQVEKLAGKNR